MDEERKNLLETIVEQINIVLYTIIPGLQVTIKNYGKQSLDDGDVYKRQGRTKQKTA